MGEKYLECFSVHGSKAKSQPGTQEDLRTMDLATTCKVLSDLQYSSVKRPQQGSGLLGNCLLTWETHKPKPKILPRTKFHSAARRLASQSAQKSKALPWAPACFVAVHTICQPDKEKGDPDRSKRSWTSRMCLAPSFQPINPQSFFSMPEDSSWAGHKAGSGLACSASSLGSAMC